MFILLRIFFYESIILCDAGDGVFNLIKFLVLPNVHIFECTANIHFPSLGRYRNLKYVDERHRHRYEVRNECRVGKMCCIYLAY